MTGVSIIVCCYNSSSRLHETLKHLSNQVVPSHIPWEVIIVDNASTDNTKSVARSLWNEFGNSAAYFKIVEQPIQGLSFAREKGIREAQFQVLIFCDDDNWLCEDYVNTSYQILAADMSIGAAGGAGMPVSDIELPSWFEDYKYAYACFEQAKAEGVLKSPNSHLYGAGLVVRKLALDQLYERNFKNILSDRSGRNLSSGGDTELGYALRIVGFNLWFSPKLKFIHYIPAGRLQLDYLYDLLKSLAFSSMSLVIYQYVLGGKNVTVLAWGKDMLTRLFLVLAEIFKASPNKSTLGFVKATRISIIPVAAIASLVGRYRKLFKSISALKG